MDKKEMLMYYDAELKWELHLEQEKYENMLAEHIDKNAWNNVVSNVIAGKYRFSENDARVLLQFKEPIFVLVKEIGSTTESFPRQVDRMMEQLGRVDILTYQHELCNERILPESFQRHDAINDLMETVPQFDFHVAMNWLCLNRRINESMLEQGKNPYEEYLKTMREIDETYGKEMVQNIFDMGEDFVIHSKELSEIAKFLDDGGNILDVLDLSMEGYFSKPYETQKQDDEHNGGMDLS